MPSNPLVSTIIPVFNGEKYICEAIQSVISQTYSPIEIIIIDDGSTDDTANVIKSFASQIRYYFQKQSGTSAARNFGTNLAKGKFFAFLDADDLWTENKINRQMEALNEDPKLDMVFGYVKQFHSPELEESLKRKIHCPTEVKAGYLCQAMLIKRDAFFRVGLFEKKWKVGEFIEWYSRSVENGLKSHMLPEVLLKRRIHANNTVIRKADSRTNYVQILKASLDRRRRMDLQNERKRTIPDSS